MGIRFGALVTACFELLVTFACGVLSGNAWLGFIFDAMRINMAVFAHSLRDNTRLQQLSLDGNCSVPEGAKALLELMQDQSIMDAAL